nr:MAG: internal scaffolding protein [Microvirus sp.]
MPNITHPIPQSDKSPNPRRRVTTSASKGRTKQEFKEESEINYILDKWMNGQPPQLRPLDYGDYSSNLDFQEAMEIITKTKEQFAGLPAKIRDRFGNDEKQMLHFLEDNDNLEEARKLGLVATPIKPPETETKIVPTPAPPKGEIPPD